MEETPLFSSPEENEDNEEDDAKSKKRVPSLAELFDRSAEKEKKEKESKTDIASFLGIKKEEEPEPKESMPEEAEQASENEKESPEELSAEEEVYINRQIAEEHLEHPVTEEEPQPPLNDFLGLVVEGEKPERAFRSTVAENQLNENLNEESLPEVGREQNEPPPAERARRAAEDRPLPPKEIAPNEASAPEPENKERPKEEKPNLAKEAAESVLERRGRAKSTKEKPGKRQKEVERQVNKMAERLKEQELDLQRLSLEKRVRDRVSSPGERAQPSRAESHLKLAKPERVGRIGKMALAKERTPDKEKAGSHPDRIRTLRRQDLLRLSENIKVEGASLRHMFESHLFGEGALRRLVEAHLQGREMLPLLKREILERQIDYERDPQLRDRDRISEKIDPGLFDQMLATIGQLDHQVAHHATQTKTTDRSKARQVARNVKQNARFSLPGTILSIVIVVLIGLIIYFVFE